MVNFKSRATIFYEDHIRSVRLPRNRFDVLKGSRLSQLVQERKVLVYHTAVFLEETLRMARSTKQGHKRRTQAAMAIFGYRSATEGWFKPLLFATPKIEVRLR